jgi:single-strand DNA-binding protein
MLNKVILIGRLANDPELKYTPSGVALSSFRVAVNRPMAPNAQGEREADFIDVVAWRQNAEFAANYLSKGRLVAVEGRLQVRSWVQEDGTRRKWTEVVCDHLKSLDRPRDQGAGGETPVAVGAGVEPGEADSDFNDPFADQ